MGSAKKLEDLAIKLHAINAVKFGDFVTKSGLKTPVYFDLRVIVSYPDVMAVISSLIYEAKVKSSDCDHICGVPYTALPIATLVSIESKKPMLMRRKEAKSYGTKKMIEGHYKEGQTCLIIEDVVTTGSSILETVEDLRKEGLVVTEAIIILDRQQGGQNNLEKNNVTMSSLFTLTQLINILIANGKITKETGIEVENYLKETQTTTLTHKVDRMTMPYEKRQELAINKMAKELFNIMVTKKSNLCLSVDFTSSSKILDLLESVGEHVCLVKTHVDILEDFSLQFIKDLKVLSKKYNFLILEDRKYADIGNTVRMQYTEGIFKVAEWADIITVHSLPGEGILKALSNISSGVFLLAEMSSEDNLFTNEYTVKTVKMAEKYPELVTGFVCQHKNTFNNPGLIQLTPGVQMDSSKDDLGQVYNTPDKVILEKGADIAVVGRGIIAAKDPKFQAKLYKEALWQSYLTRIA